MLKWFVDGREMAAEIKSPGRYFVEEEHVEVRPEKLPDAVLDQNIDVHLIRKFFTQDAWLLVEEVVKQKCNNPVYICKLCSHDFHEQPSIMCDHCLTWNHLKCLGLKKELKAKYWYCRDCHDCPLD